MKYVVKYIKNHPYCLAMLYFVFYIPAFFMLEKTNSPKIIIQSPLDDMIPFIAAFIFPYFSWHILFPCVLIFFMIKDKEDFLRLCFVMFTGMTVSLIIYAVFPTGLQLRVPINGNSVSERLCVFLYSIDTPANVFPSIHVSSTVAISLTVWRSNSLKNYKAIKIFIHILSLLIILSTLFLKQHSLYDVFGGIILSIILWLVSGRMNFGNNTGVHLSA